MLYSTHVQSTRRWRFCTANTGTKRSKGIFEITFSFIFLNLNIYIFFHVIKTSVNTWKYYKRFFCCFENEIFFFYVFSREILSCIRGINRGYLYCVISILWFHISFIQLKSDYIRSASIANIISTLDSSLKKYTHLWFVTSILQQYLL